MAFKRNFLLHKHALLASIWTTRRLFGYARINKQMTMPIVAAVSNQEQSDWWVAEITKLSKRRDRLDKKLYGI